MNATGHVQSNFNFAQGLLGSNFYEPQKNKSHLIYLHLVCTSVLFIICEILNLILQISGKEKLYGYCIQQPNVTSANQLLHLSMTSLTRNVA